MDEDEIEGAKETLANGLSAFWVIAGEKVSEQLDQALNEQISYDISEDMWLDIIGKLRHPKLAEYVRQRVLFDQEAETYSSEELSTEADTNERLQWLWKELKGTTKSIETLCQEANFNKGEEVLVRVAQFEEELCLKGLNWMLNHSVDSENLLILQKIVADSYDYLDNDEKWSLMPLFFNEAMTKRKSRFLSEQEANDAYFEIFYQRVKADGLKIKDLKAQFLGSGYGDLMPCLHIFDPHNRFLSSKKQEVSEAEELKPKTKRLENRDIRRQARSKSPKEDNSLKNGRSASNLNNRHIIGFVLVLFIALWVLSG